MTDAIARYFLCILQDGDFYNDWLTHLPEVVRPFVLFLGYVLSLIIGG